MGCGGGGGRYVECPFSNIFLLGSTILSLVLDEFSGVECVPFVTWEVLTH